MDSNSKTCSLESHDGFLRIILHVPAFLDMTHGSSSYLHSTTVASDVLVVFPAAVGLLAGVAVLIGDFLYP